jgi:hypothetical protein
MQTDLVKYTFITVCCATTIAASGGTVITPTYCNPNMGSAHVRAVEASEKDCSTAESSAVTLIPDAARFRLLTDDWRRDTLYESSVTRAILHRSHMLIVKMDKEVVLPFIFAELRDHGGHWYWALSFLTGETTIGDRGDSLATVKAKWLDWGRQNGYLRA